MKTAEKVLRKKIEEHNINNLTVEGEDFKEFEDVDLKADVVDERIEMQIRGRLNEELRNVKKGSMKYQAQEKADIKRVKDSFYRLQRKQKMIRLELK